MNIRILSFLTFVLFLSCSEDPPFETKDQVYTETFDNPDEWEITVQKDSADTRSGFEFASDRLHLIAGSRDNNRTDYRAQVTARKTVNEFDINAFSAISEIKIKLEFDEFLWKSFYFSNTHQIRLKIGPYTISQRSQLGPKTQRVTTFTYIISVPRNGLHNATAKEDVGDPMGRVQVGPITSDRDEFTISTTEFNSYPIVEFSVQTNNAPPPGGGYPAYSNSLIIKSIEITVSGELAD